MTTTTSAGYSGTEDIKRFLAAVINHAYFCADLTAAALREFGVLLLEDNQQTKPVGFPAGLLFELSAVSEIGSWERIGIFAHSASGLPTYQEAANQLADKIERGEKEFDQSSALGKRVFEFWISNFALDGRDIMGADFILGRVEDELADVLSEFLFAHRNQLSNSWVVEETK